MAAFFINLVYKSGLVISRFLFYKVLVRLYRLYFWFMKRLGWNGNIRNKSFTFFVNQKLIHATVGALTIFFVIFNLTQKTQAVSPDEAEHASRVIKQVLLDNLGAAPAEQTRIIYGGSVNPENVGGFLNEQTIDGILVGGASLKIEEIKRMLDA